LWLAACAVGLAGLEAPGDDAQSAPPAPARTASDEESPILPALEPLRAPGAPLTPPPEIPPFNPEELQPTEDLTAPSHDATDAGDNPAGDDAGPLITDWSSLLRGVALELIPEDYADDRHWGATEKITVGVKVRTSGGRLQLEERRKRVNHGLWRRVRVQPIRPDQTLRIEVRSLTAKPAGDYRCELWLQLRARCEVQFAHWVYGVKGLNGTADADISVQVRLIGGMELVTIPSGGWLPAVKLIPAIDDLDLKLTDLDVRRIGVVGGWAAEELGNGARKGVEDLLQSQEPRLLKRARRKLARAAADWTWRPGDFALPGAADHAADAASVQGLAP
jgi:hypothetical protein